MTQTLFVERAYFPPGSRTGFPRLGSTLHPQWLRIRSSPPTTLSSSFFEETQRWGFYINFPDPAAFLSSPCPPRHQEWLAASIVSTFSHNEKLCFKTYCGYCYTLGSSVIAWIESSFFIKLTNTVHHKDVLSILTTRMNLGIPRGLPFSEGVNFGCV